MTVIAVDKSLNICLLDRRINFLPRTVRASKIIDNIVLPSIKTLIRPVNLFHALEFWITVHIQIRIMSTAAVQKLVKPQFRGIYEKKTKFHLVLSVILSIGAGLTYKYTIGEPRKKAYAEFYKNYDADQDFERMRKLGLFSSCPADD